MPVCHRRQQVELLRALRNHRHLNHQQSSITFTFLKTTRKPALNNSRYAFTLHLIHSITTLAQYTISAGESPSNHAHHTSPGLIALLATAAPTLRSAYAQQSEITVTQGPFKGTRASLAGLPFPGVVPRRQVRHLGALGSAIGRRSTATGTPATCTSRAAGSTSITSTPTAIPPSSATRTSSPPWKGDQFDPDHLIGPLQEGRREILHAAWASTTTTSTCGTRSTSRAGTPSPSGPKKDVVGLWAAAARKHGLKFAVSEHLSNSYNWFAARHGADKTGPLAGVPYDGTDPAYADLYHASRPCRADFARTAQGHEPRRTRFLEAPVLPPHPGPDRQVPARPALHRWRHSLRRVRLLRLVSHLYNVSASKPRRQGRGRLHQQDSRQTAPTAPARSTSNAASPTTSAPTPGRPTPASATGTTRRGIKYKTPKTVIDMLCDIVSRNGNLMLNFPLPNSGKLDADELEVLDGITEWMAVNSEGIYATRPWKIFGEGPSTKVDIEGRWSTQRKQKAGLHCRRHSLHHQRQHALRVCSGLAGIHRRHPIPSDHQPAKPTENHQRHHPRPRSAPQIHPGRHRPQRHPSHKPPTHRQHRHHPQTHHHLNNNHPFAQGHSSGHSIFGLSGAVPSLHRARHTQALGF